MNKTAVALIVVIAIAILAALAVWYVQRRGGFSDLFGGDDDSPGDDPPSDGFMADLFAVGNPLVNINTG